MFVVERGDAQFDLAGDLQRFAARRQHPHVATAAQHVEHDGRSGLGHVLAVVDDDHHVSVGEAFDRPLGGGRRHRAGLRRPFRGTHRSRHHPGHGGLVDDRGQLDEPHLAVEREAVGDFDGQP